MKLPIDGIQAFVLIADLGNFARAADRLFLTQTALTRRIQKLEAFVGVKLLDRTTRSTSLTPMGRQFLPLARRLVDDLTEGLGRLRTASQLALGDVTLATIQSVAFHRLPSILRDYARTYPNNRVQMLERSGSLVTEAVRNSHADFGIHIQQEPHADLDEQLLMRDPFVLVCHREHALAGRKSVPWKALRGADLITLGGSSGNRRIVEAQLTKADMEPRGRFVVENTPSAITLAAANVGVAILPAAMRASATTYDLVEIPITSPVVFRSVSLIRRRNETLTPAAEALYRAIKAGLLKGREANA